MCVYVWLHACACVCIYVNMCVRVHECVYKCVTCAYVYMCVHVCICVCVYKHVYAYLHKIYKKNTQLLDSAIPFLQTRLRK